MTERDLNLALGVAAARAIRNNLPLDGFGDARRLNDWANIWGAVARNAILSSPEFEALIEERARGAA